MRKFIVCAVAWLVLVGEWRTGLAQSMASTSANQGSVEAVGMDREGGRVATSGTDVPLRHALELIVSSDYSINLPNAGPWADTPLTWYAGHSVVQTLHDAFANHPDLIVQLDGDLRLLTVRSRHPFSEAPAPALNPVSPVKAAVASAQPASGTSTPAVMKAVSNPVSAPIQPTAASAVQVAAVAPQPIAIAAAPMQKNSTDVVPVVLAALPGSVPIAAPAPPPIWRMDVADKSIRSVLERWAKQAGWQLVWEVPVDFGVDASATLHGTFEEALQSVIDALAGSSTPIQAVLYRGNKVLRIVPKGAG